MSAPGPARTSAPTVTPMHSHGPALTGGGCTVSAVALVVTLVAVAVAVTILWLRWDEFTKWSAPYGNAASVLGLAVSLIGFFLALLTLWDTRRINTRAQRNVTDAVVQAQRDVEVAVRGAQEAVHDAYRQTRLSMEKMAMILLVTEAENLCRLVFAMRDAGGTGRWEMAAFQCQEATLLVARLAGNPHLVPTEENDLRASADALGKVLRYINGRLAKGQLDPGLPNPHATNIDGMILGISAIVSRLRKLSMEVPRVQ